MSLKVDKSGFPQVVKEEYRPVFEKFMETELVQALPEEQRALAFVSYMQKIDRSTKYEFDTEVDLGAQIKLIKMFLRRNGLIHGLAVKSFDAKLYTDQNTFINALFNPAFVGICCFENGSRGSVKRNIEEAKTVIFGGRLPRQFENPKNLKTVLRTATPWVRLQTNPMLEAAVYRTRDDIGLVLRYKLALDQIFYYGGKESSVNKLQSNIKRQIMARRIYDGV